MSGECVRACVSERAVAEEGSRGTEPITVLLGCLEIRRVTVCWKILNT